ncbi:MAG: AraC family transcriptional regulator [Burkholderiales bacterium]
MDIEKFQNEYFSQINFDSHLLALFDNIDGLCFFVKNTDFELVYVNDNLLEMYKLKDLKDIIGKTDYDILDTYLADKYRLDDIKVMKTGVAALNMIELVLSQSGIPDWFITNKIPLYSKSGQIFGLMGTMKHITVSQYDSGETNKYSFIYNVLDYIAVHIEDKLTVKKIASHFNVSERCLEKRFNVYLNMTPGNFLIKYRILKACDFLLKSGDIAQAALKYGFFDQSAFTKQFKRHMHMTPLQYLKKYR